MGNELAKRLANLKIEAEKREDPLLVGIVAVLQDICVPVDAEVWERDAEEPVREPEPVEPEPAFKDQLLPPIPEKQTEPRVGPDLTPRDPESEED